MNNTILDFSIVASGLIGYFTSVSLCTVSFYKNQANNYLSVALFLLTSLTLLGWFDIENTFLALRKRVENERFIGNIRDHYREVDDNLYRDQMNQMARWLAPKDEMGKLKNRKQNTLKTAQFV